ncbi:MAG: hypothetical protein GX174_04325 [Lentisphaerae bacterium]|jgi:hypothetical protein|nr:hypothetical protein [Lentisphaerota bacterium]
MTSTRNPPGWAFEIAKAFNWLRRKRGGEIDAAVDAWTAWEIEHLHDKGKPALPKALHLGYACAVLIGTVSKVVADSPESTTMLAGLEVAPVPDDVLADVLIAAVAPYDWQACERDIRLAWDNVSAAFEPDTGEPATPAKTAAPSVSDGRQTEDAANKPLTPTERGRLKAKVRDTGDRARIRAEVKRLSESPGMTVAEACIQACEKARNGMIQGKQVLSMEYRNLTPYDVRRIFNADW